MMNIYSMPLGSLIIRGTAIDCKALNDETQYLSIYHYRKCMHVVCKSLIILYASYIGVYRLN